jgi:hypothetical protein
VLERLLSGSQKNHEIQKGTGYSYDVVSEALQELQLLGMAESESKNSGYPQNGPWRLTEEIRVMVDQYGLQPVEPREAA